MKLYPNPTTSQIKFSGITQKQSFEIYAMDGKMITKGWYLPNESIDVSKLNNGDYIIVIDQQKFKFIKR